MLDSNVKFQRECESLGQTDFRQTSTKPDSKWHSNATGQAFSALPAGCSSMRIQVTPFACVRLPQRQNNGCKIHVLIVMSNKLVAMTAVVGPANCSPSPKADKRGLSSWGHQVNSPINVCVNGVKWEAVGPSEHDVPISLIRPARPCRVWAPSPPWGHWALKRRRCFSSAVSGWCRGAQLRPRTLGRGSSGGTAFEATLQLEPSPPGDPGGRCRALLPPPAPGQQALWSPRTETIATPKGMLRSGEWGCLCHSGRWPTAPRPTARCKPGAGHTTPSLSAPIQNGRLRPQALAGLRPSARSLNLTLYLPRPILDQDGRCRAACPGGVLAAGGATLWCGAGPEAGEAGRDAVGRGRGCRRGCGRRGDSSPDPSHSGAGKKMF
ncbi:unnamed protein product [Eretmochelys imbricata]